MKEDQQVKFLTLRNQFQRLPEHVQAHLRIMQSVQNRQYQLGQVFGNVTMVCTILAMSYEQVMASPAKWFLAVKLLLTAPVLQAHLRLRKRSRPKSVSPRHIRLIEIYTFVMALVWASVSISLMPILGQVSAVVLLWMMIFTSIGSVAMSASMPKVSITYSTIILLPTFAMAYAHKVLPFFPLTIICSGVVIGLVYLALQGWHNTIAEVQVSLAALETEAEKSRVTENLSVQLGKFLSPQLVQAIIRGDQLAEITSHRRKLTVFFSDIAEFTEITDQMEPEELTALLNKYLSEMSDIATAYGGTIDKFIGDAIVVYFGDPESLGVREDAGNCVRMAIAMQKRVHSLQEEWQDMGLERGFALRIGINTGYCTVGNFGSKDRMDYTIIGSEVNLAARLENAAEVGSILLANETHSLVKDLVVADESDPITVKGIPRPVRTFRVLDLRENVERGYDPLQHQSRGMKLELDPSKLDAEGLSKAEDVLETALIRVRQAKL